MGDDESETEDESEEEEEALTYSNPRGKAMKTLRGSPRSRKKPPPRNGRDLQPLVLLLHFSRPDSPSDAADSDLMPSEERRASAQGTESSPASPPEAFSATSESSRRRPGTNSENIRDLIDAKVLELLSCRSQEGLEDAFMRSLSPILRRIPEEKWPGVHGAVISVLEAFIPPNDPGPILRAIGVWRQTTHAPRSPAALPPSRESSPSPCGPERHYQADCRGPPGPSCGPPGPPGSSCGPPGSSCGPPGPSCGPPDSPGPSCGPPGSPGPSCGPPGSPGPSCGPPGPPSGSFYDLRDGFSDPHSSTAFGPPGPHFGTAYGPPGPHYGTAYGPPGPHYGTAYGPPGPHYDTAYGPPGAAYHLPPFYDLPSFVFSYGPPSSPSYGPP
ncbi:uncharacterized protein [Engystomops pustulosus]|uniref:uncharacterized protein n=1 Tax=Engystomops pustulosus TaxID=76066 RepID=UPI003AFA373B